MSGHRSSPGDASARVLEVECRRLFPSGFDLDVSFSTRRRITALFGPSGAGKTSVLMAIAGFLELDGGRIVWNGKVLFDQQQRLHLPPHRRHLGVVFQDQRLFPHLSVGENLRFGAKRRRGTSAPELGRIASVLELDAHLDRDPATLSGGERQRVALGRALMSAPELLLMDEPVAAVDEPRRETILRYVDRVINEWDLPTVYVSHHRAEVKRLADWVVVIDSGRVVREGAPTDVLDRAADADLVGEPINLLQLVGPQLAADGTWTARVANATGDLVLHLPAATVTPPPDPAWVQFAPAAVMISRGEVHKLSARNRIAAEVRELVPRRGRVFVGVRAAGVALWAEVTQEAIDELGLAPGQAVTCLIKSAALELVL